MNVLYVCADRGVPVLGNKGASVHVRSITTAIQRLGHPVTLAAVKWGDGNDPPPLHRLEALERDELVAAAQLSRLIRQERADVVIERYSLQSGAARAATLAHALPLTLEVNAPLYAEATRFRGLDDPDGEAREHEAFRAADRIQAVSLALKAYAESVAPDVPVEWMPNGADVQSFRRGACRAGSRKDGQVVIGFAGSMKPWHGVEQLLDAFSRVASHHRRALLVLVGSGPQEETLRARAARLAVAQRIRFTGAVPHADVPAMLAEFDLAVAPYLPLDDFYFQPLKVVEYLAAGKPVIYSDQGELRTLVADAGMAYTPGSAAELADRLAVALSDPLRRAAMAACARTVGTGLDWSAVAARLVRFAATGRCFGAEKVAEALSV